MHRPILSALAAFLLAGPVLAQTLSSQSLPARPPVERPGDWGAYLAGRAAGLKLDTPAAAEFLARALNADPENPDIVGRTMLAALADGRDLQAVLLARRLAARGQPMLIASLVLLAEDARNARHAEVARAAAQLPRQSAGPILAPVLAAWAAAGEGNPAQGFAILQPLAEGERLKAFYAIPAALLADRAGNRDEANRMLAIAAGEPLPPLLSIRVAEIAAARGNDDQRARIDANLGDGADDVGLLRGRLRREPLPVADASQGMAESLLMLAAIVRQQEAGDFALLLARLALMIRPDHGAALMLVADVLDADDRHLTAAAILLDRAGRTEDAVAALRALGEAHPQRPQPWARMGDIFRARKRYAEAAEAYTQALARMPEPRTGRAWTVLYSRGMSFERAKDWPRAEADFLAALDLSPEQPYVLNYLAYTWVDRGEHLDRGRAMLERAVELSPNDGHIVDSLGWALFRLGDFPGAVKWLERAVELEAADPVINDHLGDAYWRVGRRAEARFQWQRALAAKPEDDQVPLIEAKIRDGLPDLPRTPAASR